MFLKIASSLLLIHSGDRLYLVNHDILTAKKGFKKKSLTLGKRHPKGWYLTHFLY